MTIASGQQALAGDVLKSLTADGYLSLTTSTVLTIASGAVTATANFYRVDTESSAASDDLDTITAGTGVDGGHLLVIRPANDARTVVVKHNTGNIVCANGVDQTLDDAHDALALIYDSDLTKWFVFGFLGPLTVNTGSIAASAVTTAKIADLNVTTGKIANAAVTETQLATSVAGNGLAGGGGTALSVNVDGTSIVIVGDTLQSIAPATSLSQPAYIGDTSNASNSKGLTINQLTADEEILSLKSSDVAHGMTSLTETDTYGTMHKTSGTAGALTIEGFGEATYGLALLGNATTADTTKSTAGIAAVTIQALLKSGTTVGSMGANTNLVTVGDGATTRFILDADGDSHQDVGTAWTNFDAHDDAELLTALSVHVSAPSDVIRTDFAEFLDYNRARLEALRLVTFNADGHHFVNMSRLTMLLVGAVRQVSNRLDTVLTRLEGVERKLLAA